MRILFTAGGSGGHFYPLMSVADSVIKEAEKRDVAELELFYVSDDPYNKDDLKKRNIKFHKISTGKRRLYSSFQNFLDLFRIAFAVIHAFFYLFHIYPDVIFTNGSYAAFPTLLAAKILRIPVMVHASDTVPSRVVLFGSKFAKKISVGFPEAKEYFPKSKQDLVVMTGNPVRKEIMKKVTDGADGFLGFSPDIKTIWVIGGSLGSAILNEVILDALPNLLKKYQIIHQTGQKTYEKTKTRADIILSNIVEKKYRNRYKIFPYLNDLAMRMSAGTSDLAVARAGAGTIYEFAMWEIPMVLIPITEKVSRDQVRNAIAYTRIGGSSMLRQENLKANILINEIETILDNDEVYKKMQNAARGFFVPDAADKIGREMIKIALEHE